MMVGGGGFCVSEGEAGVGKSYGRARRGCEARQGSGQSRSGPWQRLIEPPAASTSSSRRLVVVAAAGRLRDSTIVDAGQGFGRVGTARFLGGVVTAWLLWRWSWCCCS